MAAPIYRGGRPFIKPGLRFANNIAIFTGTAAPVDGTTSAATGYGFAGVGSLYIRSTTGVVYINSGVSKTNLTWTVFGTSTTSATFTTPLLVNPTISGPTPVSVTGANVTLGATHKNRTTVLNAAGGVAVTLPAASGTGDVYRLVVGTASNANTVVTAPATDFFQGLVMGTDSDDTAPAVPLRGFSTASTTNKISPTTAGGGGLAGDWIELQDYAAGLWTVRGVFQATTAPASPFSHV